jgi:hypothetical protein
LVLSLAAVGVGVKNLIMQAHASALTLQTNVLLAGAIGVWLLAFLLIQ